MTASIQTTLQNKGAFPNQSFVPVEQAIPDALAINNLITSQAPALEGDGPVVNVPFVDTDPTADFTAEAAEIAESSAALSELAINTAKIGLLTSLSNEAYSYSDAASLITDSARRAITDKADYALLANPATDGQPTGLANIPGIVTVAGTDFKSDGLTPILQCLAECADNGCNPTSMIMQFSTWARLLGLTAADGRPLIQPDVVQAAQPTLYSVPVIISRFAPVNSVLIVDASQVLCSFGQVAVSTSTDALFAQDSTALKLTVRIGFGVPHPNRLGLVTLAADAAATPAK